MYDDGKVISLSHSELALEIRLKRKNKAGEFDIPIEKLIAEYRTRKTWDDAPKNLNDDEGWIG